MKVNRKARKELPHNSNNHLGKPATPRCRLAQRQAKGASRASENIFKDLTQRSLAGVYLIQDGIFKYGNPRFAEIFGYTIDEVIDKLGPQDMVLPEDWPTVRDNILKRISGDADSIHYEFKGFTKTNVPINIEVYGARITYQGKPAVMGTLLDITERKRAEDAIHRLNEFKTTLIENAPIGICTLNNDGEFTSVNAALNSLFGFGTGDQEKLIGQNWLKHSYAIKFGLTEYISKGLQGEPFRLSDFPYTTHQGDRNFYMDFRGVPLRGKSGDIEGLLCIIEETTDRVTTRAKLMQEAKMSAVGRLAAGVAHELNNPLATLVAHSELARRCLASLKEVGDQDLLLRDLKTYLEIVEAQAFRCKSVTNDILSLPWREGLNATEIDINVILKNILEFTTINKHNGKIVQELFPSLPSVLGDITTMRQVFINLIGNAIDAIEGRPDGTIWLRTKVNDNKIVVEVEDNGPGIPASIKDKIFEPFFTTKESKKGMGLGLSLCKEFVSSAGGTIEVDSIPGRGTIFLVTLPQAMVKETGSGKTNDSSSDR